MKQVKKNCAQKRKPFGGEKRYRNGVKNLGCVTHFVRKFVSLFNFEYLQSARTTLFEMIQLLSTIFDTYS